jgi:PAS domain S-box-containing protein
MSPLFSGRRLQIPHGAARLYRMASAPGASAVRALHRLFDRLENFGLRLPSLVAILLLVAAVLGALALSRGDVLLLRALAMVLFAAGVGYVWWARLSRSLAHMAATAARIAEGETSLRVEARHRNSELRGMADAFNRMVDSLVSSERRLSNILDMAGDAIITVDENQRIVAYNRTAEQIFGYAPTEVLGQPLDKLLPAPLAHAHREYVQGFAKEDGSVRVMGGPRGGRTAPRRYGVSRRD